MSLSNTQIAKSGGKNLLREEFLFHGVRPELVKEETIEDTQGDVSPIIQAREKLAKLQQLHREDEEDHACKLNKIVYGLRQAGQIWFKNT